MTKSVKEKDRLAKIRECRLNGIPVPAELLNVKFIRPIKTNKEDKSSKEYNIYTKKFQEQFKGHVNNMVIDIANQMETYDINIKIIKEYYLPSILLYLVDNRNKKNLGQFRIIQSEESVKNENFDPYDFHSYVFNEYGDIEDTKISHLMDIPSVKIRFFSRNFLKNISGFKHKTFYKNIYNFISKINNFTQYTKIPQTVLFFDISEHINCELITKGESHKINNINNVSELYILKAFIEIGCVDIHIPEEELIIKNVGIIKDMIRLSNY